MGKGDQRSKRGKIIAGSYGVSRPKRKKKALIVVPDATTVIEKKPKAAKPVKEEKVPVAEAVVDKKAIEVVDTVPEVQPAAAESKPKKKSAKPPKKAKAAELELNLEAEAEDTKEKKSEATPEA